MSLGELPIRTSMAGYYRLNGTSSDVSGNGRNGTDTAITYGLANGKFGQGALFNGTSSKIVLADSDAFSFTNGVNDLPFTISLWAKFTSATSLRWLIHKRDNSTNNEWQLATVDGAISFSLWSSANVNSIGTSSGVAVFTSGNTWYNIIATYDASKLNTGLLIYVNGAPIPVTPNSGGTYTGMVNGTAVVNIGMFLNNAFFSGSMDEIIIEPRLWSASEIKKYYSQADGRFLPQ